MSVKKRLRNHELALVKGDATLDELLSVLKEVFPDDPFNNLTRMEDVKDMYFLPHTIKNKVWVSHSETNLPAITVKEYYYLTYKQNVMLNKRALLKSLSFTFLPTVIVLLVVLLVTFDFQIFLNLLLGKTGWAYLLRIVLLVAEGALVWYMYGYYKARPAEKNYVDIGNKKVEVLKHTRVPYDSQISSVYETADENVLIVIKKPK